MFSLTFLQTICWLGFLACLFFVIKKLDWQRFKAHKSSQHLIWGAAVCIFGLWLFRVGIFPGLNVHFLWITALTLLLGFRWALVSGSFALLVSTIAGYDTWAMLGVHGMFGVVAPVVVSYLVYNLSFHKLPRNFFVYVFVCAFFCGALAIAVKMLLLGGYYYLDGFYSAQQIIDNYLMLIVLLVFSEAMLNGMTMTLLVIYKPAWVYTFYDKFYLNNK